MLQAAFTGLAHDESYYWVWTRYPSWWYFDHPPAVMWFIQAGYAIFPNELGVRLVTVLSTTLVIYLVYRMGNIRYTR